MQMMMWILLLLVGISGLHALPKSLTPGACTTKTLPAQSENDMNQQFLDSYQKRWFYTYSSVIDKEESFASNPLLVNEPLSSGPSDRSLTTYYNMDGQNKLEVFRDYIVIGNNNKLVSKSTVQGQEGKPETEYVILKFEELMYVYFYVCSNDPGAEKGRDARFVVSFSNVLSKRDEEEIEEFDRTLTTGDQPVFSGRIQKLQEFDLDPC